MQNSLNEKLFDKVKTLFFQDLDIKNNKDEILFESKKILFNYGIDEIDFLKLKYIIESLCILKGFSYQDEFKKEGLDKYFDEKKFFFRRVLDKDFISDFDKDKAHIVIMNSLLSVCKNISNEKNTYSLRIEDKRTIKYFIQKNKIDKYILFFPTMHGEELYIRRFMCISPLLTDFCPDEIKQGKKIIVNHKNTPKIPYIEGYFLSEIEELLKITEGL